MVMEKRTGCFLLTVNNVSPYNLSTCLFHAPPSLYSHYLLVDSFRALRDWWLSGLVRHMGCQSSKPNHTRFLFRASSYAVHGVHGPQQTVFSFSCTEWHFAEGESLTQPSTEWKAEADLPWFKATQSDFCFCLECQARSFMLMK